MVEKSVLLGRPKSVVVSHPTGNENSRHLVAALNDAGLLGEYRTTLGFGSGSTSIWLRTLGTVANKRKIPRVSDTNVRRHARRELLRNVALRSPTFWTRRLAEGTGPLGVDWVAQGLDQYLSRRPNRGTNFFYGYSAYALEQLRTFNREGVKTALEVQHVLWRTTRDICASERSRSPTWAATLPSPPTPRKSAIEDEELRLADYVLSPAAQVSDSIRSSNPAAKIVEIPYGCPAPAREIRPRTGLLKRKPRVLFVGRVVALKGAADYSSLVEALAHEADFSVVGPVPSQRVKGLEKLLSKVNYLGTMNHDDVLQQMDQHDLLVAPSLTEGRSLSVLEAVSRGLPVVVTPGTGADDLARAGAGTVVDAQDANGLVESVRGLLDKPATLCEQSDAGIRLAASNSWATYEAAVVAFVRSAFLG